MKYGEVYKKFEPDEKELEKINSYTRRKFLKEEIYTFSVVLCDNDVDRDMERFTVEALFDLEKLFVGKTGVFDHNPKALNQSARIFECNVENVAGKKTICGDDYFRLVAKAYIPKSEKTEELILSIDSGILKEVSVGCAVGRKACSVCSEEEGRCSHIKGETYGDKKCFFQLEKPYDAYEWSFVAVPAQKNAGIIKSVSKEMNGLGIDVVKQFVDNPLGNIDNIENKAKYEISFEEIKILSEKYKSLEKDALWGKNYRQDMRTKFLRLTAVVQPEISESCAKSIAQKMSVEEMKEFILAYEKKAEEFLPVKPQTFSEKKKEKDNKNNEFEM